MADSGAQTVQFHSSFSRQPATSINKTEPPATQENVRLVIWDLDETFWKGTVTEGGIQEYIREHHDIVIELARRGILSSICSKNDHGVIEQILEKYEISKYFIFPSISWGPKGVRIASILEAVQLRAPTVMFIDDNPNNRAEALDVVPGLQVEDEFFISDMLSDPRFKGKDDSALSRLKQYQLLEQRKRDESKSTGDNEAFLRGCDVRVYIEYDVEANLDRAIELINRTNQLNYTKRRLPESLEDARRELLAEISVINRHAGLIRVVDKYGDYGFVGFFLTENIASADAKSRLRHFCFSCRTLGMLVEHWVYNYLRRPLLKVVGEVLTDLSAPRSIDWIRQISTLDDPVESLQVESSPDIVLWGGCETNALSIYAANFSKNVVAFGNYASSGFFVRLNSSLVLASMASRSAGDFKAEAALFGLPASLGHTDIFSSRPRGAIYIVNCSFDASNIPLYRHKESGWVIHVEIGRLPGVNLAGIPEPEIANTIEKLNFVQGDRDRYLRVIKHLSLNYENVRPLNEGEIHSALDRIVALLPQGAKLILVVDHDEACNENRNRYKVPGLTLLKRVVSDFSAKYDFVKAIPFSDAIQDPEEIGAGGGSHYVRQVYIRFMQIASQEASKLTPKRNAAT
jgi:FkbH-like protein